jgi:xylitol oxidase
VTSAPPLTNWAGNLTFSGRRWHHPSTVDELCALVRRAEKVHAVGAGHSFSRVADGPGDLVSLAGLPPILELDPGGGTVTVSGGVRYGELAPFLHQHGYALANLASLPHLTVVGAVATGTHGSGSRTPGLAAAVTGLTLVTASGELVRLERGHTDFDGAVVALGALGVVASLTLALEPTYEVSQYVYEGLRTARLTGNYTGFAEVFGAGYSVSAFTDWSGDQIGQLWVKRRSGVPPPELWLGAELADGPRHPVPGFSPQACTDQLGEPGPWYQRLPHFRLEFNPSAGKELQSEYLLPVTAGPAALRALAEIGPQIAAVLQISEVRTVAADELWLSMAYQRDSVALHFTWRPDEPAVLAVLAEVERVLAPFHPRPHWAKLHRFDGAALAAAYPRWSDFAALRTSLDPTGKFANPLLEGWFGAGG